MVGLLMKWRQAGRALGCELDRAPSFGEIASSLGLSAAIPQLVGS